MKPSTDQWKSTSCILCSVACGIEVQEQDGRITKIRGDNQHPVSQGYLCQKASRLDYYQNHDGRLQQPLKRMADGTLQAVSWELAINEIATKLKQLRSDFGGHSIAFYGGGGQANHLGGTYAAALRAALGTEYLYSSLAQEKTGDFWVNGKLFGRQNCLVSEGMHDADFVIVLGANPWASHGLPQTRKILQDIRKDPNRTLVVIDPRVTETAEIADIHLQVKPGRDAFLLSAIIAIIVQEQLFNSAFLTERCTEFDAVQAAFSAIDAPAYAAHAGVEFKMVQAVARGLAAARRATVRADLGIQQSLHSTLNSYLEKLLFLLTGNFNRAGTNLFMPIFAPFLSHSEDPDQGGTTTRVTGMRGISKIYPPNVLPAEILTDHPDRTRALIVDSSNPALSAADSQAYRKAFAALDLLVVIDVALTETARQAHYVLPAQSQFEKTEASFFTYAAEQQHRIVPHFFVRKAVTIPQGNTLTEAEIYHRLTVAIGALPPRIPLLEQAAKLDRRFPSLKLFGLALAGWLKLHPRHTALVPLILYSSYGKALPPGMETAAVAWGICQFYVQRWEPQIRMTGLSQHGYGLANAMFDRFLQSDSAAPIASFAVEDMWKLLRHSDKKIHLAIPALLEQLAQLKTEMTTADNTEYPFILAAGERRTYNANLIIRDSRWRKKDIEGSLRMHPDDAASIGIANGAVVRVQSGKGEIHAAVVLDSTVLHGVVTLPHGYGMLEQNESGEWLTQGPAINHLTDLDYCDPIAMTPYHKTVPVRLLPA